MLRVQKRWLYAPRSLYSPKRNQHMVVLEEQRSLKSSGVMPSVPGRITDGTVEVDLAGDGGFPHQIQSRNCPFNVVDVGKLKATLAMKWNFGGVGDQRNYLMYMTWDTVWGPGGLQRSAIMNFFWKKGGCGTKKQKPPCAPPPQQCNQNKKKEKCSKPKPPPKAKCCPLPPPKPKCCPPPPPKCCPPEPPACPCEPPPPPPSRCKTCTPTPRPAGPPLTEPPCSPCCAPPPAPCCPKTKPQGFLSKWVSGMCKRAAAPTKKEKCAKPKSAPKPKV